MKKTFVPKPADIARKWHIFDAKDQVLGRLATKIAVILMGKHRPDFARHVDGGDHVVVINASKVAVTGRKEVQKLYHRHSGYPGGMKVTTLEQMRANKPEQVIIHAIAGMLPDNKLQDRVLKHLHVYPDETHPYEKQFKSQS